MSDFESQILFFYDKSSTRAQIRGLAGMYGVSEDKIIDVLKKNGREIPEKKKGPKPKTEVKNVESKKEDVKSEILPMPECVVQTIEKRMAELDADIKNYQDMVNRLEAEYSAHAKFLLSCPFEQRNLSHSCSDDNVESPQAMA